MHLSGVNSESSSRNTRERTLPAQPPKEGNAGDCFGRRMPLSITGLPEIIESRKIPLIALVTLCPVRPISRHTVVDLSLSVVVLYASFWIYEFGNYVSLMLTSANVSLATWGVLPVGTVALFTGHSMMPTWLAKVLQVILSASLMLLIARRARASRFELLEGATICILSIFLASVYWESLTEVSVLSYGAHELLYVAAAVALQVGLMRAMKYSPSSGDSKAARVLTPP
jgi:hypothetical protein